MREEILKLFEKKEVKLTLEQIIKQIKGIRLEQSILIKSLKTLELDGQVYYDDSCNCYCTFPSDFYLGTIKKIYKDKNYATIKTQNNEYNLELPDIQLSANDIIIFKKRKNKFILVKKLERQKENNTYNKVLMDIFYPLNNGLSILDIIKQTNASKKQSKYLTEELNELVQENKLGIDTKTNKYYPVKKAIIQIDKKGQMYIEINKKKIKLPIYTYKDCLKFDTILLKDTHDNYEFLKVISRGIPEVVCEVTEDNKIRLLGNPHLKVTLKDQNLNLPIGTRILVNISTQKENDAYLVTYLKTLGHKNDFDASLNAIAYSNGFRTDYTEAEIEQINSIPTEVSVSDLENRIDLTNECIFTIDGEHTKDIDDAVSIKKLANGNYELIVSIAAVNSYIEIDSPLWKRAYENTTSLYLIDSVSHMIHPKISNGICSLNPNVLRLAKSFKMEIDNQGNLVNFDILNSYIKSRKKMTYENVNKILEENIIPEDYEEFIPDLLLMKELSDIIDKRFQNNGAIDFSNKEIYFVLDDNKEVTQITTTKSKTAENLIKNFMIMTNESVADYLLNLGIVGIYRNHEIPFNEKLLETTDLIKSLGYKIEKIKNSDNPKLIQNVINNLSTKEEFFILSTLLLKSMQKAYYSPSNQGHFALALNAYTQSTSPIRRFLDLVVQYILNNIEMFYDESFDLKTFKEYIKNSCQRANMMEKCAKKAEYEANKLYMMKYCMTHPDEEYVGFIQDIEPNRIHVKTTELIEGYIKIEDFNDGNYIYNYKEKKLIHKDTKEVVKIGTKVFLTYNNANEEYLQLYFNGTTTKEETLTRKRA